VSNDRPETESVLNFLDSLPPPVHVILLYGEPPELDDIESKIMVETPREDQQYPTDQVPGVILTRKGDVNRWTIHRVEPEAFSNLEKLMRFEEGIRKSRQPPMALCAYPLKHVMELDMSVFVDIFSLHDYVMFSKFVEGQKVVQEAVEEALERTLGRSGSETIYRFARNMGIKRRQVPNNLRRFRRVLREFLGTGADFLERVIFQRLYLKLRS